jgi:trypsin
MKYYINHLFKLLILFQILSKHKITAFGSNVNGNNLELRIIGGHKVDKGRFEYMVTLVDEFGSHFCGGVLIGREYVLSAAHCAGRATTVEIGRHDLTSVDEVYDVITIDNEMIHPDYNDVTLENDIMVIKLQSESEIGAIVSLDDGSQEISEGLIVSPLGWGITESGTSSSLLLSVDVEVVNQTKCNEMYMVEGAFVTDAMLCARGPGKDSCQGDSGGPLILKGNDTDTDILVGIVSWGFGCADPSFPGVYARVSYFYEWIGEQTQTMAPTESYSPTVTHAPSQMPTNSVQPTMDPCPGGNFISITVNTDLYPAETSWTLFKDGEVLLEGGGNNYTETNYLYQSEFCDEFPLTDVGDKNESIPCYGFSIRDSYGDGFVDDGGYYIVSDEYGYISFEGSGNFGHEEFNSTCPIEPCPEDKLVSIHIHTDSYPTETSFSLWKNGSVVFSYGNYFNPNTLYKHEYCDLEGEEDPCYDFIINDVYGDGFNEGGYYAVYKNKDDVIIEGNGNYGYEKKISSCNNDDSTKSPVSSPLQSCPDDKLIMVDIKTDNYPSETSWELKRGNTTILTGGEYVQANTLYTHQFCDDWSSSTIDNDEEDGKELCLDFIIIDFFWRWFSRWRLLSSLHHSQWYHI